jgi:predicted flavoprotein YhiN
LKQKRLAIIGGGASGMAAALEAAYTNPVSDITVFDKMPKACKKILATGNGRCNFSNTDLSPSHFHGSRDFLKNVLVSSFADDESFFREMGILTNCEDGRLYPKSQQALTICDALVDTATSKGVKIITTQQLNM